MNNTELHQPVKDPSTCTTNDSSAMIIINAPPSDIMQKHMTLLDILIGWTYNRWTFWELVAKPRTQSYKIWISEGNSSRSLQTSCKTPHTTRHDCPVQLNHVALCAAGIRCKSVNSSANKIQQVKYRGNMVIVISNVYAVDIFKKKSEGEREEGGEGERERNRERGRESESRRINL